MLLCFFNNRFAVMFQIIYKNEETQHNTCISFLWRVLLKGGTLISLCKVIYCTRLFPSTCNCSATPIQMQCGPRQISIKCIVVRVGFKIRFVQKTQVWTWVFDLFIIFLFSFLTYSLIPTILSSAHLRCLHLSQMKFTVFIALMRWVATLAGYYWFCRLDESIIYLLQVCTVHTERK